MFFFFFLKRKTVKTINFSLQRNVAKKFSDMKICCAKDHVPLNYGLLNLQFCFNYAEIGHSNLKQMSNKVPIVESYHKM